MRMGWVGNFMLVWDYGEPTRELILIILWLLAILSLPINIMPFWEQRMLGLTKGGLGDPDLRELEGGCAVDAALARGLCVERDGFFQLWFLAFTFSKRWFQVWRDARLEGGR
ncbi:hypothetical protein FIBSPDRAFT_852749 [Athelia psychrophila]|uniref:Uncharacterized protein n=1 Tax=Athelia psychrophila TaxID=1759441 RepID=A0A166RGJ2_9AGAM|nr:hypothetical protein FIBSPDRAFT_852749 [Fibularhizoctonia sp. CBS 109695]